MKKQDKPFDRTISRRSLFEWLGGTAVLGFAEALSSTQILGCALNENIQDGTDLDDGSRPSGSDPADASTAGDCPSNSSFSFTPGNAEGEIFENWGERTVDPQDLARILSSWTLVVDGLVEKPLRLDFASLLKLKRQDQITDFHCVEGWSVYDIPWNGVHLKSLFDLAKPLPEATYVTFHTFGDKYNESLPLAVALEPKTLLAYGIDCATLPLKHGFPLRLVVPRKLAYKNAKYVYRIELAPKPITGFWVAYGYSYEGDVPPNRLRPGKY